MHCSPATWFMSLSSISSYEGSVSTQYLGMGLSYVFGRIPLLCLVIVNSDVSHQRQTLRDHIISIVRIFTAHLRIVIGKRCHEFKRVLSSLVTEVFVLYDRYAENDKI